MIVQRLLRIALLGSSWVLYLLLALSVVSIAAMVERWIFFRKNGDAGESLRNKLGDAFRARDLAAAERALAANKSVEAGVLHAAIGWADGGADAVSDAIDSEAARAKKELEKGTAILGTLGNNAPFIGLLGTVLGVIEAFHHLADSTNKAAMGNVMAAIAEALIATGVGLFVALPAVVAFNMVQKRIGEVETNIGGLGKLITAYLKAEKVRADRGDHQGPAASEDEPVKPPPSKHTNGKAARAVATEG